MTLPSLRLWHWLRLVLPLFLSSFVLLLLATSPPQSSIPAQINLQVIVVGSLPEAQQVEQRLKKGEDFAVVAKEKSIDPSAPVGGYLGKIDPTLLRPEMRAALAGVPEGQITPIIKIANGYVILKVLPEVQTAQDSRSAATQSMSANPNMGLASRGAIIFPADIGGNTIADLTFQQFPKPPGWEQDPRVSCKIRKDSLAGAIDRLNQALNPPARELRNKASSFDLVQQHYGLAQLYSYQGNMDQAIEHWEQALSIATAEIPAGVPQLEEVLGIAYLHRSEMRNDIFRAPGELCLFPPRPGVKYAHTADSEKAIEYFVRYLEEKPDRAHRLQVKWLLNLAYMTLGKYPSGVPPQYRMVLPALESKQPVGRFQDVAPAAGLDLFSLAGGIIIDDFDGDGLLDVVTSSYDFCEPLHFFHNNGDGTFSDRTAQAGLLDQLGGLNMIQADYNNDGCMDILVLRGAWEFPSRKSLLRNNCDGTFTDVTKEAGLAEPATRTQAAVWADIDNDGFVDLFVGNENGPSQLFRNRGDGTFEDISHAAGIDRVAFTKGVVAADYDNDGYVDFYVSNLYGGNFLYHNNHDGTFTEVSQQAGVHLENSQSFATWFFDYDNDGWPDLFVTSYYFSIDESLRSYLGLPINVETQKLFRNLGNGTFKDVTKEVGLAQVFLPMGANFGDFDNDGFLDIYLATGGPAYGALMPKVLLQNQSGRSFVDVTAASGTGELHKGHGTAFADLANRGFEDLLSSSGGATPGDAHALRVFRNPGNDNDWITVRLVGVKSNRAAIGSKIKVTVENKGQGVRSIYRTVGSGGSFGASPLEQHIGLGKAAQILSLEITWPASKTQQKFTAVGKNQFLEIKEFAQQYTVTKRKQFILGGSKAPIQPAAKDQGPSPAA